LFTICTCFTIASILSGSRKGGGSSSRGADSRRGKNRKLATNAETVEFILLLRAAIDRRSRCPRVHWFHLLPSLHAV